MRGEWPGVSYRVSRAGWSKYTVTHLGISGGSELAIVVHSRSIKLIIRTTLKLAVPFLQNEPNLGLK
jgi:hypothetical protein